MSWATEPGAVTPEYQRQDVGRASGTPGVPWDDWAGWQRSGRMKRRLKPPAAVAPSSDGAVNADAVLQVKVWLVGISPMVWR